MSVIIPSEPTGAAVQTAFDQAVEGDTVYLEPGVVYNVLSTIYGKSGVALKSTGRETGGTLEVSNFVKPASEQFNAPIIWRGSTSGRYSLIEDAVIGDNYIVVDDSVVGVFQPGDLLRFESLLVWKNNERGWRQGEYKWLSYIDGNRLYLTEPLEDTYPATDASNGVGIRITYPVSNVTIDGIRLINTVIGKNMQGLLFQKAYNLLVQNSFISMLETGGIYPYEGVDVSFLNNHIEKSWRQGLGYGIAINNSFHNILIEGNQIYSCRHHIAYGGSGYGVPRHAINRNNYIQDSQWWNPSTQTFDISHCLDCHHTGEDINYLDNEVTGIGSVGIGGYGMYTGVISGNYIHDFSGSGIKFTNHEGENIIIENNIIEHIDGWGILLGNWSSDPFPSEKYHTGYTVRNNQITDVWVGAIALYGGRGTKVYGNNINGCSGYRDYQPDPLYPYGYGCIMAWWCENVEIYNNVVRGLHPNGNLPQAGVLAKPYNNGGTVGTRYNISLSVHDNDLIDSGYMAIQDLTQDAMIHYRNLGADDWITYNYLLEVLSNLDIPFEVRKIG
jgi:hypothetical protein